MSNRNRNMIATSRSTATVHPLNRLTDRRARANADRRLDKLEQLEARLEIKRYRN